MCGCGKSLTNYQLWRAFSIIFNKMINDMAQCKQRIVDDEDDNVSFSFLYSRPPSPNQPTRVKSHIMLYTQNIYATHNYIVGY